MIRLLTEKDQKSVLDYLYHEPTYNIFLIGDIETYGFNVPFQRIYAEFDDEGHYRSVFLRYRENAIYYAHEKRFNEEYLSIFNKDPFNYISGKSELMAFVRPHLVGFSFKHMYFCEATSCVETRGDDTEIKTVKTEDDARHLFDLLQVIDEFNYKDKQPDVFVKEKMESLDMGITLFIEKNHQIVSTVATTAETTKNAMVVAVATHPNHRERGYASRLMKRLMTLYIQEKGKSLCLFYNNPDAGKIYHRLGFKTIGTWDMHQRQ
jgi:predicted GNAT family acetyltransferase